MSHYTVKFKNLFIRLVGNITWTPPSWLNQLTFQLRHQYKNQPVQLLIWMTLFIALLAATTAGYITYRHYQQQPHVIANIHPLRLAEGEGSSLDPLIIEFGTKNGNRLKSASSAALELIGKKNLSGIKMEPSLPGEWEWLGEDLLVFTPKASWPAGQKYQLTLKKELFSPHIHVRNYRYEFSTPTLAGKITEMQLYQDPKDPLLLKVIATLNFNYPVDSFSIEKNSRLILQQSDGSAKQILQELPLSASYDNKNSTVYLESAPIKLSELAQHVNLSVEKGVSAIQGPGKTENQISQKLLLLDFGSFLKVNHVEAAIERDANDQPIQILTVSTTAGVSTEKLMKYLSIYVLPTDYPASLGRSKRKNYAWSRPGEVTEEVLKQAKPLELEPLPEEHAFPTQHRFKFNLPASNYLYLQIAEGMSAAGGFSLKQNFANVFRSPEYPQGISFQHKGSLLALTGDKTLTVGVRGIPEIKISIYQILPEQVNHLITQTYGRFHSPHFLNSNFGPETISQLYSEYRQFATSNPGQLNYTPLDLGKYLKASENALGLFLVKVQAWDSKNDVPSGAEESRLILITDLSLIVKDNADHTHDLFVHSITQGIPVAEAQISLVGKNGHPIFTGVSDKEGRLQIPSVKDFKEDREPAFYLVNKQGDISFIPFERYDRKLNLSRFDIDGISAGDEGRLYAYLFSDRGMYRPGETWHVGMIVKEQFGKAPISGLPLEAVVKDPFGMVLHKQKFILPESHLMLLDYTFSSTAPSGHYHVSLYIAKDKGSKNLLGDHSVQVAEFIPDRLKMDIALHSTSSNGSIASEGWLQPSGLKAKINLWNLFGIAAADHRIEGKMSIFPCCLQFPQFSGYNFVDPWLDPKKPIKHYSEDLPAVKTDTHGKAEFMLHLDRFDKAAYTLSFLAEGFEDNSGRGIRAEVSTLVSPLGYLIGYKTESKLRYLKQHSPHCLHFIAVTPQQSMSAVKDLKLKILASKTTSALVKKPNGTYQYQSVLQEAPIDEQSFEIGAEGSFVNLPTDVIGDFSLHLTDANGMLLSKADFSVIGSSNKSITTKSELKIKLDKTTYDPGESIELQVTAPFAGTGLITIERDKTYVHQWFKTESTTSVQKIKLPQNFQGNGYVNVAFVRSWDSDEVFINPLCTAVAPFNVSHNPQTLQVDLNVPAIVRAGDRLHIEYKTDQPSKLILFVVDEGILQLSEHQTPDPLAHFFRKQALGVSTSQIADLILPKQSGDQLLSVPGGDHRIQPSAKNLNPFKHSGEKSVAFCSGILESGTDFQTETVQLPDYFNGQVRVMAVAVSENTLGSTSTNTTVQADFVIHPTISPFITPGDHMIVTASIANCQRDTTEEATVDVQLKSSEHFEILGATKRSLTIPHHEQRVVAFEIKALEALGEGQLTFEVIPTARLDNLAVQHTSSLANSQAPLSDKTTRTLTLSVRPASAHQSRLTSGYDTTFKKTVPLKGNFYPEYRTLTASASTNPLILAQGLNDYLKSTHDDLTEQIISKAMAQVVMESYHPEHFGTKIPLEDFKRTLQLLRERQTDSGGFSCWANKWSTSANEEVSVLAADFLIEAAHQGYPIPEEMLNAAMHYLENVVQSDASSLSQAHLHSHAIYLLTRNGLVTTNYLTNLQTYLLAQHKDQWQKELLSTYIAATYFLLQDKDKAKALAKGYSIQTITSDSEEGFHNTLCKHAQHITLLARHFPERLKEISGDAILSLVQKFNADQLNTLSAGWSIRSLAAYANTQQENESSLKITALLPDGSENPLISHHEKDPQVNFDPLATSLNFYNPEKQMYFYQIHQAGFDAIPVTKPETQGIELFRDYLDQAGQVISRVKCGEKITANIKVRTLNQQEVGPIRIVDLLPAGFAVIPHSIAAYDCDCVDMREDRIIFYCSIDSTVKTLSYTLQAINEGEYAIPPISAQAIYQPEIRAQGIAGRIVIKDCYYYGRQPIDEGA